MANMGKQYVTSRSVPNFGRKKREKELRKFPQPGHNDTAPSAKTDLSDYRQPQPGEMIANVMKSQSTSKTSSPPNYLVGKQLQAPRRNTEIAIPNPPTQLKATPRTSYPMAGPVQMKADRVGSTPQPVAKLQPNPSSATQSTFDGARASKGKGRTSAKCIESSEESRPKKTGLPGRLKTGIENLSGYSMEDVRVHYNSDKPAQLQAHAYAQGTDIHVAPGQEKHLPHEAWHVVQQKKGSVLPTSQLMGKSINEERHLEQEADVMGRKASHTAMSEQKRPMVVQSPDTATIQGMFIYNEEYKNVEEKDYEQELLERGYEMIPTKKRQIVWAKKKKVKEAVEYLRRDSDEISLTDENIQTFTRLGTMVEQDSPGYRATNAAKVEYYYKGSGTAYTTRIQTCTALAIRHIDSGKSFLCHADGGVGNYDRIKASLETFRNRLEYEGKQSLSTKIYTARKTYISSRSSFKLNSYSLVRDALKNVLRYTTEEIRDRTEYVQPVDVITVTPGEELPPYKPWKSNLMDAMNNTLKYYQERESIRNPEDDIKKLFESFPGKKGIGEDWADSFIRASEVEEKTQDPDIRAYMRLYRSLWD